MTTLAELDRLLRSTGRLWVRGGWRLGAWFCLGFALHALGLEVSAVLGSAHDLLATLAFVGGVTASLLSLIAMINTLRRELRSPASLPDPRPARLPAALLRDEPFVDLLTATLGPFLAVYAVWGLVEDEARALFRANQAEQGLGGVAEWSISWDPDRLPFYAVLLAGSWLLRFVVQRVHRRVRHPLLAVVGVVAEAVVVFASFATLIIVGKLVSSWLATRVVVVGAETRWRDLIGVLPDLRLPFDLTLPRVVATAADWLVHTLLPALGTGILLPLVWLALAAMVFGWREFAARDVVAGRATDRLSRFGADRIAAVRTPWLRRLRDSEQARSIVLLASADLRTKYVPLLQALRLVLAAGPRLVGVYLVLATALAAAGHALVILISITVGPTSYPLLVALDPATDLLVGLVIQPLLICLYVAVVDQALTTLAVPLDADPAVRAADGTSVRATSVRSPARGPAPTPAPGS